MKKSNLIARIIKPGLFCLSSMMFLSVGLFSSCSSDDDNETSEPINLETPAYKSVSAKYNVTSGGDGISSIELTESGEYIVIFDNASYAPKQNKTTKNMSMGILNGNKISTRAFIGNIHGKFTKKSDNEFILDGFGTIVITGSADNAISIKVTTEDGEELNLNAEKATILADTEMTKALCRTWNINTIKMVATFNGKSFYDSGARPTSDYNAIYRELNTAMQKLSESINGEEDNETYFTEPGFIPEDIIFTKAGTYLVTTESDQLSIYNWAWQNESKGELRYTFKNGMFDEYISNTANVKFSGNTLTINEINLNESEGGMSLQVSSEYKCSYVNE